MNSDSAKLLNLISQDYSLVRKGKFFTTEEHDSLVIDPQKALFFWNSKVVFGDALDYLIKVRGIDRYQAIVMLGETSDEYEYEAFETLPETPNPILVDIFYEYGKNYKDYWYNKRGYTDETIDKWKLGFTGKYHVIPIYQNGKFVNFQCRGKDAYGNKITKPFYQGGEALPFNLDYMPKDKSIPIFICESPVEVIIMEQNGYHAIGNMFGAMSWQQEWSKLLFDREIIYICYDNDDAGRKGSKRTSELLQHNSYILDWPKNFPAKYDLTDLFIGNNVLMEDWFVPAYVFGN